MVNSFRLRAKRTTGSNPPPGLLFGELAYSDANETFYIGRADPAQAPAAFEGSPTDYSQAIAELIADLATLNDSQAAQDTSIATLNAATDSQADAIGAVFASTNTLNGALLSLAADVQAALETKANDADLAVVSKTGAYSDLTGLPTLFSGAYADLSGKPALFSGAYSDLTGRPTIPAGFTYDQQTEPVGPVAGATWRERSAGGLIVEEWEWTGSVWCSLTRTTVSDVAITGGAASYPGIAFEAPRCLFVQCRVAINPSGNPATPFNSSNYRELTLSRSFAATVFTFRPMISIAQAAYVSPMNYLNPSGACFFTGTTVVGSPGTMHAPGVSWVYREVRA